MSVSAQVLVVSPDAAVLQAVQDCAQALGHSAFLAVGLAQARRLLTRVNVDLICVDSVLPQGDVETLLRECHGERPGAVFIAPPSAKLIPAALPACYSPRRDGLVAKPLRIPELEREVTRLLSSAPGRRDADLLRAGPVALDPASHQLLFERGGAVALTPTEFRLMRYLMERPGRFVSPQELLEQAWGYPKDTGGAEVVRAHVSNVRRKLRAAKLDPQVLRNIPYQGYAIGVDAANGTPPHRKRGAGYSR
jgi:DNA-binding response OmpR family regulator